MSKAVWSGVITAAAVLMLSSPAFAQPATDSKNVTVSANVDAKAKLDLGAHHGGFSTTTRTRQRR